MSSGSSGRPKGTQNRPGHSAGGSRMGAGRKRKVRIDSPEIAEPVDASPPIAPAEAGPGEPSQSLLYDLIDNLNWHSATRHKISVSGQYTQKALHPVFGEQILILIFLKSKRFMPVQVRGCNHRHLLSLCSQINVLVPLTQAIQIHLGNQLTATVKVGLCHVFLIESSLVKSIQLIKTTADLDLDVYYLILIFLICLRL